MGISGSTGQVLVRALASMRELVDRSFVVVRLKTGLASPDPIVIGHLMEEVEVSAMMQAVAYGHQLTVETRDATAVVHADRQILASILMNLLQNAFKYTRPHTHVTLRTSTAGNRVLIEVEDECGGLPAGTAATLFEPYVQRGVDHSGLGLGLSICQRGAEAIGGTIQVRDLPVRAACSAWSCRSPPRATSALRQIGDGPRRSATARQESSRPWRINVALAA